MVIIVFIFIMPAYADNPVGIASVSSDGKNNYTVPSDILRGYAEINGISTFTTIGSSLQLNGKLLVKTSTGYQYYGVQNVMQFAGTEYQKIRFIDNIWDENKNQGVTPAFNPTDISNNMTYYAYNTGLYPYTTPFTMNLTISQQTVPNQGVILDFYYTPYGKDVAYDEQKLTIPNIIASTFITNSEFVWAGLANGQTVYFPYMDSTLGLYYSNWGPSITWHTYPAYSPYGIETLEKAENIASFIDSSGLAHVANTGNSQQQTQGIKIISNSTTQQTNAINAQTSSQNTTQITTTPSISEPVKYPILNTPPQNDSAKCFNAQGGSTEYRTGQNNELAYNIGQPIVICGNIGLGGKTTIYTYDQNSNPIDSFTISSPNSKFFSVTLDPTKYNHPGTYSLIIDYGGGHESYLASFTILQNNMSSIPNWVKNNAKWWSEGSLSDQDFIKGIQYLIQNGIMKIPPTSQLGTFGQIPPWVKNTAGWWANGQISDDEFVRAIQYLVANGIIKV